VAISGKGGGFRELVEPGGRTRPGWRFRPPAEVDVRRAAGALHADGDDPTRVREPGGAVFQFEGNSAPYVRLENCRNVSIFQGIAGHWSGAPGPMFDVVGRTGSGAAQLGDLQQPECHHGEGRPAGRRAFVSGRRGEIAGADGSWIKQ